MENNDYEKIPENRLFKFSPGRNTELSDYKALSDYRRYILLKISLIIIAVIGFGYSLVNIKRGVMPLAITEIALIPICAVLVWLLRYAKLFNFVKKAFTVMVCIFGLSAAAIPNTFSTIFVWNAIVPVFAFFLWGKKGGILISAVLLPTSTLLFLRCHASGPDSLPLAALSNTIIFVLIVSVLTFFYEVTRADTEQALKKDIASREQAEKEKEKLIVKLQKALTEVKTLSGMLPICANCKKIRDDKGYWNQIELFIQEHSSAEFSHGICPECAKILYGNEK